VVIKAEADAQGTNRRVIVTNRAGAFVLPGAAYDEYADRGEAENRNKEWKRGLKADRLSDHRYFANLFRLYLHAQAYNLLVHVRQHVEIPLPENFEQEFRPKRPQAESADSITTDDVNMILGDKVNRARGKRG
jgi:hypothetical protein